MPIKIFYKIIKPNGISQVLINVEHKMKGEKSDVFGMI